MKIKLNRKQKKILMHIFAGAVLFVVGMLIPYDKLTYGGYIRFGIFLAAYIASGGGVLLKAGRNILNGQIFDENFLMCVATIGAFAVGEYSEGVEVMLFFMLGELFENYAVSRSRQSISSLMDIRPDSANVIRNGETINVSPDEVRTGETIIIAPGERIPLDAVVVKGYSSTDTSKLTGESVPVDVSIGDTILSGCINLSGVIEAEVTCEYNRSTAARILELVEKSASSKAKTENFITRFAAIYTPAVVSAAALLAVIPSLITGEWSMWIYRALTFLVISCPCALVISVPLAFFGGIGAASSNGILVKGGNYLEALAHAEIAVMDKTGTLTKGIFSVTEMIPEGVSDAELLEYAAYAECFSSHPISVSLRKAYGNDINTSSVNDIEETAGGGVTASVRGKKISVGKYDFISGICKENFARQEKQGSVVYVSANEKYIGCIVISDEIKSDAAEAISEMREAGIVKTVMLTGDSKSAAEYTAEKLGIDEVKYRLLPDEKAVRVSELKKECSPKGKLIFTGDGINDAVVLACADVGIAMGGLGSDAAIEAADVVIMDDKPSKIPIAMDIARNTRKIVIQNIVFSLGVKALILILGALGIAGMQAAVFADVGVAVIAICNSMRALYYRKKTKDIPSAAIPAAVM